MDLGLLLSVSKLALEVFKNERGDLFHRLTKENNEIEKDWLKEMAKHSDKRDDLELDRLMFKYKQHLELIRAESVTLRK